MFPAATPEANVIRYRIFFRAPQGRREQNSTADAEEDRAFVAARHRSYNGFITASVGDFIWQKHSMHLSLNRHAVDCRGVRAWCLQGESNVGDAIDDEWVITWLLIKLTTEYASDDAIVTVNDTDGEFLLIECADALPQWVSPENSAGRVFIRTGRLHIVPVSAVPETGKEYEELYRDGEVAPRTVRQLEDDDLVFVQSLRVLVEERVDTRASAAMQRALEQKLREPPQYIRSNRHRVRCLVPTRAAEIITARPDIIGAAVEAFFYRVPTEAAKISRRMAVFSPGHATMRRVAFSRCQYAQLKQQQFYAPKPFSHWPGVGEMGTANASATATEIGVKLACGLELLYASGESDQFGRSWRDIIDSTAASPVRMVDDASSEPDDDDAWLYMHPDTLDERLHQIASRSGPSGVEDVGGADELQNIAAMFNNFMSGVSGLDGVENSAPVQLDMSSFLDILKGAEAGAVDEDEDDEDEWDDPRDDSDQSSIDSDDEIEDEPANDAEDRILRDAMAEMDAELSSSTLAKSFATLGESPASQDDQPQDADRPLNLDFNLLSNLLESLASQDGMAGPVTSILSELSSSKS